MDGKMKAAVIENYGPADAFKIIETDIPEPLENQLLVKVYAAGINPVDTYVRAGRMKVITGSTFPKILGSDLAGEVEDAGSRVKNFKQGDKVYASTDTLKGGAYAEYAVVDEDRTCLMPENTSFTTAAAVPIAGVTALQSIRMAGDIKGKSVLINGASGGVGTFGVQIAKILGANVAAVCGPSNTEMVKSLGADTVINYSEGDFTGQGIKYDHIFDFNGNRKPAEYKKILKGTYITTVFRPDLMLFYFFNRRFKPMRVKINPEDLKWLKEKLEEFKIKVVIDSEYTFEEIADAHKRVETKHAKGKVVIKIR